MTSATEDEDLDEKNNSSRKEDESSGEGSRGKSGTGSAGGAQFSAVETEEEAAARRAKKGDSGEGDADSFGRGKAGAGAGIRLSAQKTKEVGSVWTHLTASELMEAVVEFFSELPMRASANLSVTWERTQANAKSFAIVNWIMDAGHTAVRELARTRERIRGAGRDSRGLMMQRPKTNMNMKPGPAGPGTV